MDPSLDDGSIRNSDGIGDSVKDDIDEGIFSSTFSEVSNKDGNSGTDESPPNKRRRSGLEPKQSNGETDPLLLQNSLKGARTSASSQLGGSGVASAGQRNDAALLVDALTPRSFPLHHQLPNSSSGTPRSRAGATSMVGNSLFRQDQQEGSNIPWNTHASIGNMEHDDVLRIQEETDSSTANPSSASMETGRKTHEQLQEQDAINSPLMARNHSFDRLPSPNTGHNEDVNQTRTDRSGIPVVTGPGSAFDDLMGPFAGSILAGDNQFQTGGSSSDRNDPASAFLQGLVLGSGNNPRRLGDTGPAGFVPGAAAALRGLAPAAVTTGTGIPHLTGGGPYLQFPSVYPPIPSSFSDPTVAGMPGSQSLNPLFLQQFAASAATVLPSFPNQQQQFLPPRLPGNSERSHDVVSDVGLTAPSSSNNTAGSSFDLVLQPGGQGGTDGPPTREGSRKNRGIPLALSCDPEHLSEYQILVRQQLEIFEASAEDIQSNTQGRKKKVTVGQVGVRCKHCAYYPTRYTGKGAVYYPAKLQGIYQAAQNMAGSHLCDSCQIIQPALKERLRKLRERKDSASGGKQYWADGCQAIGLIETKSSGLRLRHKEDSSHGRKGGRIDATKLLD